MTQKYRLYKLEGAHIHYLHQSKSGFTDRRHAGLFTEAEYLEMGGKELGLQLSPIGEDEALRRAGAVPLPGLD